MRPFLFAGVLLVLAVPAWGQKQLEGLWEGVITQGSLQVRDGYKFELFLQLDGQRLKGRSYVYLENGKVIEMDVQGHLYQDRSMYLHDIRFIPLVEGEAPPSFRRKYQMIYSRSIWESTLEGYWQEVIETPFSDRRRRGRIFLKKKDGSKA